MLKTLCVAFALLSVAASAASIPSILNAKLQHLGGGYETTFQKMGFPGAMNCTENWFTQYIDHFTFGAPSGSPNGEMHYQQRYLTYDAHYKPGGPIFFYVGNEGPIPVFANIAGLMWQSAEQFGAALVFAEHRFFGKSQPCNGTCKQHLSTMQALADYSVLLTNLTSPGGKYAESKGIITFGGSYGGMLSAWFRMKYPNLITGAIACSAPIGMVSPAYHRSSYWSVVTRDATAYGGSAPHCAKNVYDGIQAVFAMAETHAGRVELADHFHLCSPLPDSASQAKSLLGYFIQEAFDLMGMGDYPLALNFIFGDIEHPAPAWPMRKACAHIGKHANFTSNTSLISALVEAVAVVYNVSNSSQCFNAQGNPTTDDAWDYMVCSEGIINEVPFFEAKGWPNDMFYPQTPWSHSMFDNYCMKAHGVTPRYGWLNTTYGADNLRGASNIVFSNGLYDPWHSGGILWNVSDTVKSYLIPEAAHHVDLLFNTPTDPPLAEFVRNKEREHIRKWLKEL